MNESEPVSAGLSPPALQRVIDVRAQLLRSITNWCGDAVEADDILQSAYLRALERGDSLRDEERVVAWFTRLVRNVAVDRMRARGTQDRIREQWSNEAVEQIDPLEDLEAEVCRCVVRIFGDLKPRHVEVIRLVELEGLDTAEVARRLGTTANNIRVRLHRSRAVLRERLLAVCGVCADHGCMPCTCTTSSDSREKL